MRYTSALLIAALLSGLCFSATIYVPDHHPTIQGAIDASVNGDTIVVRPGTYVENIDFKGKAVTLESERGAAGTVIDGNRSGSVVTFASGESSLSMLLGFTITNGSGHLSAQGGGIYCSVSSPAIRGNVVTGNVVSASAGRGGGIYSDDGSSPQIVNNVIAGNKAGFFGGGIFSRPSLDLAVVNNVITANEAPVGGGIYCRPADTQIFAGNYVYGNKAGSGGGLYCEQGGFPRFTGMIVTGNRADAGGGFFCENASRPTIVNCTIRSNGANREGGAVYCDGSSLRIVNSILWDNRAPRHSELPPWNGGFPWVTHSDVQGGHPGRGNIDADPLFVDESSGDFHLRWDSPCRNAGDNAAVTDPFDREGDPRIAQGTVDIGADEFYYHLYSIGDAVPGGTIRVTVIGPPGRPAFLGLGRGVQDPPQTTPHGALELQLPLWKMWSLGAVPGGGAVSRTVAVPSGAQPGARFPFQALVGRWGQAQTQLTNLLNVTVQ